MSGRTWDGKFRGPSDWAMRTSGLRLPGEQHLRRSCHMDRAICNMAAATRRSASLVLRSRAPPHYGRRPCGTPPAGPSFFRRRAQPRLTVPPSRDAAIRASISEEYEVLLPDGLVCVHFVEAPAFFDPQPQPMISLSSVLGGAGPPVEWCAHAGAEPARASGSPACPSPSRWRRRGSRRSRRRSSLARTPVPGPAA